jgi:hypothetical protein
MSTDCYCDYDPPSFFRSHIARARKQHECYECRGPIRPGDQYEYAAGLWDGDFMTFKTCERCRDLRTWVKNNLPCFCWSYGNMRDDAAEAIEAARDHAPQETQGLKFGFLRRVVAISKARQQQGVPA